jgi:hypothetical protein
LIRNPSFLIAALSLCVVTVMTPAARAFELVPGDLYSSNYDSTTIKHYSSSGTYINSLTLPSSYGSEVRGLSFGPDGRLYAVTVTNSGFGVVVLDSAGLIQATYSGSSYVAGDIGYGKIAFAKNGQFFVAGSQYLVAFTPGSPIGSIVYTNNSVQDIAPLASGNLLVLSAYQLQEITTSGALVRTITSSIPLGDAVGLEYDPTTNAIFVTMLGYTGQQFRLMRLDGTSGLVQVNVYFVYGADIALTSDRRLVVGSRTQAPGIFDIDLNRIGTLTSDPQMFVTQMPIPQAPAAPPIPVSGLSPTLVALLVFIVTVTGIAILPNRSHRT